MVGVSLGGWLALDYAARRPERVESLVVLCPGGVGRAETGILFKVFPLLLLGPWERRKAREMILGRAPAKASLAVQHFIDFVSLIHQHFRPRRVKLPIFSNDALKRLTMHLMAIVGGKTCCSIPLRPSGGWNATLPMPRFATFRMPAT
jgi:pimeloyl-ACP methyl ester carboxylesterase